MKVTVEKPAATRSKLVVSASPAELDAAKAVALEKLGKNVRLAGFREGKAPANLVEKSIDPEQLQTEVLQNVVNDLYGQAVAEQKLKVVGQPEIAITKFVPFSALEFSADVEVVGDVKLGSYKTVKLAKPKASVAAKDITGVLDNLNRQNADRKPVERAAKLGDEATIDFSGRDAGTNQKINGADGKDYPLVLGSKQFIPGFEEEIIGLKPGAEKEFAVTFPQDYGITSLRSKKVNFTITLKKLSEVKLAKIDDAWANKISPFKNLAELKADIKKQLTAEKQRQLDAQFQQDLLAKISDKSTVEIPKALIDEEIERLERDELQNLAYRGQTFEEHLSAEGVTAEQHKEQKRPAAEKRVKDSLVLSEIAEKEGLDVTNAEIEDRLGLLRQQYRDPQMLAELARPAAHSQIGSQILTEKTFAAIEKYAKA